MSGEAVGWAFRKVQMDDATAKFVLVAICNYANENDEAWPSHNSIARLTGFSRRTIQNSIQKLEDWGLIARVRRVRDDGSETSAMVRIDIEAGWIVEKGVATRATAGKKMVNMAREVMKEIPEGMAAGATLERTIKPQVNNMMADDYFTVEAKALPPAEKPKRKVRATIDPHLPLSDKNKKYATDRGFSATYAATVFDNFKNYHLAKGSLMLDWDAAWRTWIGNETRFTRHGGPPGRPARSDGAVYGDDYM